MTKRNDVELIVQLLANKFAFGQLDEIAKELDVYFSTDESLSGTYNIAEELYREYEKNVERVLKYGDDDDQLTLTEFVEQRFDQLILKLQFDMNFYDDTPAPDYDDEEDEMDDLEEERLNIEDEVSEVLKVVREYTVDLSGDMWQALLKLEGVTVHEDEERDVQLAKVLRLKYVLNMDEHKNESLEDFTTVEMIEALDLIKSNDALFNISSTMADLKNEVDKAALKKSIEQGLKQKDSAKLFALPMDSEDCRVYRVVDVDKNPFDVHESTGTETDETVQEGPENESDGAVLQKIKSRLLAEFGEESLNHALDVEEIAYEDADETDDGTSVDDKAQWLAQEIFYDWKEAYEAGSTDRNAEAYAVERVLDDKTEYAKRGQEDDEELSDEVFVNYIKDVLLDEFGNESLTIALDVEHLPYGKDATPREKASILAMKFYKNLISDSYVGQPVRDLNKYPIERVMADKAKHEKQLIEEFAEDYNPGNLFEPAENDIERIGERSPLQVNLKKFVDSDYAGLDLEYYGASFMNDEEVIQKAVREIKEIVPDYKVEVDDVFDIIVVKPNEPGETLFINYIDFRCKFNPESIDSRENGEDWVEFYFGFGKKAKKLRLIRTLKRFAEKLAIVAWPILTFIFGMIAFSHPHENVNVWVFPAVVGGAMTFLSLLFGAVDETVNSFGPKYAPYEGLNYKEQYEVDNQEFRGSLGWQLVGIIMVIVLTGGFELIKHFGSNSFWVLIIILLTMFVGFMVLKGFWNLKKVWKWIKFDGLSK